jgi:hypothetical protein
MTWSEVKPNGPRAVTESGAERKTDSGAEGDSRKRSRKVIAERSSPRAMVLKAVNRKRGRKRKADGDRRKRGRKVIAVRHGFQAVVRKRKPKAGPKAVNHQRCLGGELSREWNSCFSSQESWPPVLARLPRFYLAGLVEFMENARPDTRDERESWPRWRGLKTKGK